MSKIVAEVEILLKKYPPSFKTLLEMANIVEGQKQVEFIQALNRSMEDNMSYYIDNQFVYSVNGYKAALAIIGITGGMMRTSGSGYKLSTRYPCSEDERYKFIMECEKADRIVGFVLEQWGEKKNEKD